MWCWGDRHGDKRGRAGAGHDRGAEERESTSQRGRVGLSMHHDWRSRGGKKGLLRRLGRAGERGGGGGGVQ